MKRSHTDNFDQVYDATMQFYASRPGEKPKRPDLAFKMTLNHAARLQAVEDVISNIFEFKEVNPPGVQPGAHARLIGEGMIWKIAEILRDRSPPGETARLLKRLARECRDAEAEWRR